MVYQYICTSCGRFSSSAAIPETELNDRCPYAYCAGRVILTEPTHQENIVSREEKSKKGIANCIIELKNTRQQHRYIQR